MQHLLDIQSIDNPAHRSAFGLGCVKTRAYVNEIDSVDLESVSHQDGEGLRVFLQVLFFGIKNIILCHIGLLFSGSPTAAIYDASGGKWVL
ncbi:hypothetical protein [Janthinobacterium sp. DSP2-3-3]|uniref:hypothetical protein n=1 Tax=Janthinobacterium sp. DSP2-3-3 TaxID=2804596 RepID=UPI003CEEF7BB